MPVVTAHFDNSYAVLESECLVIEGFIRKADIRSVLEFGPGRSTLMFAAAGCEVWSAEYNDWWFEHYRRLFAEMPAIHLIRFQNAPLIEIPELDGRRFDLAFIDSPAGHEFPPGMSPRQNTCEVAAKYVDRILLHDIQRPGEQATIRKMQEAGWDIECTWESARCALLRNRSHLGQ
uniref:Class I SAM-dependent methyltransferase n=1 Tax=Schlesneria paludicola TaxID=360056 RepID=A0A7C4LLN1_9PLAN